MYACDERKRKEQNTETLNEGSSFSFTHSVLFLVIFFYFFNQGAYFLSFKFCSQCLNYILYDYLFNFFFKVILQLKAFTLEDFSRGNTTMSKIGDIYHKNHVITYLLFVQLKVISLKWE